jgi:hypothetical protein
LPFKWNLQRYTVDEARSDSPTTHHHPFPGAPAPDHRALQHARLDAFGALTTIITQQHTHTTTHTHTRTHTHTHTHTHASEKNDTSTMVRDTNTRTKKRSVNNEHEHEHKHRTRTKDKRKTAARNTRRAEEKNNHRLKRTNTAPTHPHAVMTMTRAM